jgi:hypothetical protein
VLWGIRGLGSINCALQFDYKSMYFKLLCMYCLMIVSLDWKKLQMVLLDRSEVRTIPIDVSYFKF